PPPRLLPRRPPPSSPRGGGGGWGGGGFTAEGFYVVAVGKLHAQSTGIVDSDATRWRVVLEVRLRQRRARIRASRYLSSRSNARPQAQAPRWHHLQALPSDEREGGRAPGGVPGHARERAECGGGGAGEGAGRLLRPR